MGRFVAFGEVMLRLSPPGRELLMQTPKLDIWVAGAEANVATALARLGHEAALVTALPDNDLGRGALATLRGHGVETRTRIEGERLGLYFVTAGAGMRATEVIYDRAHSAFAEASPEGWDWDVALAGADRLHLSGVTPALGVGPAQAALAAARAASERGVPVSFDGNYRAKLWERWDSDPRATLTELVGLADLMFGNHRDVALLLGRAFSGDGADRRREAAEAAFEAFPRLQLIASTARTVESVDRHRLTARVDTRAGGHQTDEIVVTDIVDRIGGGDAFAAGVLHALRRGGKPEAAALTGLTLAALKHSLPGDASLFREADLAAALAGEGLDVRR
jgi:2-dehydro-3-deoxygluconokinase